MAIFKQVEEKYTNEISAINLIHYIKKGTGYWNCPTMLPGRDEVLWAQMNYIKRYYGKTDGNQLEHYVLSFDTEGVERNITVAKIQGCCNILSVIFKDYQPIWAIHFKETHYHIHLVINTVNSETGLKYHKGPKEFNDLLKRIANELAYLQIALQPITYFDEYRRLQYGSVPSTYLYQYKEFWW